MAALWVGGGVFFVRVNQVLVRFCACRVACLTGGVCEGSSCDFGGFRGGGGRSLSWFWSSVRGMGLGRGMFRGV